MELLNFLNSFYQEQSVYKCIVIAQDEISRQLIKDLLTKNDYVCEDRLDEASRFRIAVYTQNEILSEIQDESLFICIDDVDLVITYKTNVKTYHPALLNLLAHRNIEIVLSHLTKIDIE